MSHIQNLKLLPITNIYKTRVNLNLALWNLMREKVNKDYPNITFLIWSNTKVHTWETFNYSP